MTGRAPRRRLAGLGLVAALGAVGTVLSVPGLSLPARAHTPALSVSTAVRDAEGMPRSGSYTRAGDVLTIRAGVTPGDTLAVTMPDGSRSGAECTGGTTTGGASSTRTSTDGSGSAGSGSTGISSTGASAAGAGTQSTSTAQCVAVRYALTQDDVDRGWAELTVEATAATGRLERARVVVHGAGTAGLSVGEVSETATGAVVELTNTGDLTLSDPGLVVDAGDGDAPATSCSTGDIPPGGTTTCSIGPDASGGLTGTVAAVAITPDGTAVHTDPAAVATTTSPRGPEVATGGIARRDSATRWPIALAAGLAGTAALAVLVRRRRRS
ncbi:hypothetical protein [Cellulomonas denverensis]|uniref:Uncharacterized protein n=1 Tax=Cellulomonas denverensis TaxID=264297 RepID=A0A7X6KVC3_9CELL|nr:hypothetical protein [Cellulomonas denverensis]NKY22996.1 hypothetical protein [Cellulomonas denverensis]GIG23926.1 hypothetical protein Cde04nite_01700 [Cellulomonas denverensis]